MRITHKRHAYAAYALAPMLGAASLFGATAANAADATQAAQNTRAIEETIVSARRQAESIQDVPLAVTAFTEEDIERVAPRTLRDFDGMIPNVSIGMNTAGPSAGAIYIRGIGYADIEKTQSPAVSVIIDGVQQGSSTGQLVDTFDVAQIEVLRGPQGVLQGKNTTGGAIVVNRIRPAFNDVNWATSLQIGSYDERQIKARVNIPLIDDTLALLISGITKDREGYYRNRTRGDDAGKVDYDSARIALLWQPTDTFSALFNYDYIKDRGDIPPQDPRYDGRDPFENEANFDEFQRYDVDGFSLNLEWELPFGTLESITGLQYADDDVGQDFDGSTRRATASPIVQLHTLREQQYEQFSEELKLSGKLFSDNVSYTFGLFYWETDLEFAQGSNQIVQVPNAAFGGACPFRPNPTGAPLCQTPQQFSDQKSGEEVTSKAIFGAINWNITDAIEVSAGVRYLDEEKDFETEYGLRRRPGGQLDEFGDPISPPTERNTVFAGFPVQGNDSWNDTVFKLSANWAITEYNRVYASYSEGFRSGGFSIRGVDPTRLSYEPEEVSAWEIGSKNDFFDGTLRVNVAAFMTTLEGAQFSSILTRPPGSAPATNTLILNNSDDTEIKGFELEAIWSVTDALTARFIAGFQDTKSGTDVQSCLVRPFNANGTACNATTNPTLFPGGTAIANLPTVTTRGGQIARSPDYNYTVALSYNADVGGHPLSANLTAKTIDDYFVARLPSGVPISEEGYTLVDAQVSYTYTLSEGEELILNLIGKNLTDEEYVEQELPLGVDGGFRGWGGPRTYAFEVLWRH